MPYPTPDEPAIVRLTCRRIFVPDHDEIIGILIGQLAEMASESYWLEVGTWTPSELAAIMAEALARTDQNEVCSMLCDVRWTVAAVVPDGWLLADGSIVLSDDYPDYAAACDPALVVSPTQVRLPNLVDRMPVGAGNIYAVDDTGGAATHTLTEAEMPAHTHSYTQPTFGIDVESVGVPDPTGVGNPPVPQVTGSAGGGQAHNNLPPYYGLKPLVRVLP